LDPSLRDELQELATSIHGVIDAAGGDPLSPDMTTALTVDAERLAHLVLELTN